MAATTDLALRKAVIYSVFIRNHTPEGTFRALEADLPRLRGLGADILWLMPIHPIGEEHRKGMLGSPYAIRDYRAVNPEYGTLEDFRHLVDAIHTQGMKCIIDVVYNHTSPDSVLAHDHPSFFFRDAAGKPTHKVADWWDIADLDYTVAPLWDYQIDTLKMWAEIVDGFRCDVASSVPVAFWERARQAVETVRPGCIWLAENVYPDYVREIWRQGAYAATDCELYRAFDITYDYDIWPCFEGLFSGERTLGEYIRMMNQQETVYPANHIKLRFLENHDQPRFASRVKEESRFRNYLAFLYFAKGTTLLYSGSEFAPTHQVSLFDRDAACRERRQDWQALLGRLGRMKKELPVNSCFEASAEADGLVTARYDGPEGHAWGVFGLQGDRGRVSVPLADGVYENRVDGAAVTVAEGMISFSGDPVILI